MCVFNAVNGSCYEWIQEISSGAIQSIEMSSSNQGVKTHNGDAKMERGPKPKRIRLSEGKQLTLKAMPILQKNYVLTKEVTLFQIFMLSYIV
jgi:hypothetical protein